MSEDGKIGNWLAGVLFERRRKDEEAKARGLCRTLFSAAITGALLMLLADYIISSLVPQYWPPGNRWPVALGGATGGVLQPLWDWFKARRRAENSN